MLADPFASQSGFRIQLIAPEFSELGKQVNKAYFDDAEYHLKAHINESGIAEASLLDWQGNVIFHAKHSELSPANSQELFPENIRVVLKPNTRLFAHVISPENSKKFDRAIVRQRLD